MQKLRILSNLCLFNKRKLVKIVNCTEVSIPTDCLCFYSAYIFGCKPISKYSDLNPNKVSFQCDLNVETVVLYPAAASPHVLAESLAVVSAGEVKMSVEVEVV